MSSMGMESVNAAQKKTLMSALDSLLAQKEDLDDLSHRSDTMREKMMRTEDHPKETCSQIGLGDKTSSSPDIVDLFNSVTQQIQTLIEKIRQNINTTIDLID